jgi:hypothetical protein
MIPGAIGEPIHTDNNYPGQNQQTEKTNEKI